MTHKKSNVSNKPGAFVSKDEFSVSHTWYISYILTTSVGLMHDVAITPMCLLLVSLFSSFTILSPKGMLAVSRSLGDQVLKPFVIGEPHVCEREVVLHNDDDNSQQRSFIIVACDGLWDVISDQEACDIVFAYKGDRNEVANVLVQEALQRGTTDNLTVVVSYL